MSLHTRKQMQRVIEDGKLLAHDASADHYEARILDVAYFLDIPHQTGTGYERAFGELSVIAACLLEELRRKDPVHGLRPVGGHDAA